MARAQFYDIKKRVRQSLVRGAFRCLLAALRPLSWRAAQALGRGVGNLACAVSGRYCRVADKNLRLAFGEALSPHERETLTLRVFQNFARATVEFLKAPVLTPDALRALVRSDVGMAPVEALMARGRGLIVVTAHFGQWELLARRATIEGYPLLVVAREGEDAAFNQLIDGLRANGGYQVHPRGASPKALLQHLRRNGAVAILPDQKSEDVFVPFFGRLAGTVAGPALLALRTGAPILPMFCPIQPDGTYRVEFGEEIDTTPTGDTDADTHRIMAAVNLAIEDVVRRYPDQWLWLHDRWRVPPPARYGEAPYPAFGHLSPTGLGERLVAVSPAAAHGTQETSQVAPIQAAQPHSYRPFSPSEGGKVAKPDRGLPRAASL